MFVVASEKEIMGTFFFYKNIKVEIKQNFKKYTKNTSQAQSQLRMFILCSFVH